MAVGTTTSKLQLSQNDIAKNDQWFRHVCLEFPRFALPQVSGPDHQMDGHRVSSVRFLQRGNERPPHRVGFLGPSWKWFSEGFLLNLAAGRGGGGGGDGCFSGDTWLWLKNRYQNGTLASGNQGQNLRNPSV